MQYEVRSPEEYLQQLNEDWRKEKLLQVRDMILKQEAAPKEFIQYKMLAYGQGNNTVFHLNAQKNYVSLYIGDVNKINNGRELLAKLDLGKGCIRIKKTDDLENTPLNQFIGKALEKWNSGGDVSC